MTSIQFNVAGIDSDEEGYVICNGCANLDCEVEDRKAKCKEAQMISVYNFLYPTDPAPRNFTLAYYSSKRCRHAVFPNTGAMFRIFSGIFEKFLLGKPAVFLLAHHKAGTTQIYGRKDWS